MDILLFSASAAVGLLLQSAESSQQSNDVDTKLRQALQAGTSLNAQERICLVTPDNAVVPDGALRADMRLNNLWHRATYILVRHHPANLPPHEHHPADSRQEEYVLVQKRSLQKDYCPGRYDPVPGGVVGYGESYRENAVREIEEEMGIAATDLVRLFTFSFDNEQVRVWGDFYECTYAGTLHDLVLQTSEVESVERMSLTQLERAMESRPQDFLPDACHAMRLYFQRRGDLHVQRRLLHGYSSGNLDRYGLRPKPQAIFFDCDDCLYFDNWKTANMLTCKIDEWCRQRGLLPGQAYELYKQYGTALRGLLAEGYLEDNPSAINDYLQAVHDIPIHEMLPRDDALRSLLQRMDPTIPKYIFTASVKQHAERCLQALGIADLFVGIIDCQACHLETKHAPHSFRVAMQVASIENAEACLFLDDSLRNIAAARHVGWRCVLVGQVGRDDGLQVSSEHAELEVNRVHELERVLPELFV